MLPVFPPLYLLPLPLDRLLSLEINHFLNGLDDLRPTIHSFRTPFAQVILDIPEITTRSILRGRYLDAEELEFEFFADAGKLHPFFA